MSEGTALEPGVPGQHLHNPDLKPPAAGKNQSSSAPQDAKAAPPGGPSWELLSTCVHCGLCLNHCPTYKLLGNEMDSPRGRIYQMLQVNEGKMPLGETFVTHIDRCLGCVACEIACPSGVKYGRIVERARAQIEQGYKRPWLQRRLRSFFYNQVIPNFKMLRRVAGMVRFYQRSGLQTLVRKSGMLRLLGVADLDRLSPQIDQEFFFDEIGKVYPAVGEKRGKVAFVAGCINNVAFSHLNRATVNVLTQNGIEVHIPAGQGCCGALHAHAGLREEARALARHNIDVFLGSDYDAIVTNAAGCGSNMKEYHDLLETDAAYLARAEEFTHKIKDVTEYLAAVGLTTPKRKIGQRVAYQDPCHLANAQRIRTQPRQLLAAIGCELVELPHSDQCCGSAGVYNVAQNELSMKILEKKMDDVTSVSSDMLATANVGCMIQLRAGMDKRGLNTPVKHVMELLDEAYTTN
ncbi:MAG TPA: heterodisulfide reductase-related iron-sulfur binding cluster [Candidatus Angelobacter sp.]|nr:heterodisulfide reductase-related iron-sulfur binding cluster [Candidatus Angelobacter sp.]